MIYGTDWDLETGDARGFTPATQSRCGFGRFDPQRSTRREIFSIKKFARLWDTEHRKVRGPRERMT
jgi:hypothetical protein